MRLGAALLILATCAAAAMGIARIEPTVDFVDTVPPHDGLAPYRAMLDALDGTRFVVVHMPHAEGLGPHLRTDAGFDALVEEQGSLQALLASDPAVAGFLSAHESVRAAHHMFWVMATAGNPPPDSDSMPQGAVYEGLRDRARDESGDVLAGDGSSAIVMVFLERLDERGSREAAARITDLVARWHEGREPRATGEPAVAGLLVTSHATDLRTGDDMLLWSVVSAISVAVVLTMTLRRVVDAALAVLVVGIALVWTFGAIGWVGMPISFLSVFLAPVVVGLSIDHAIHLLHAHRRAAATGAPEPMKTALRTLRGPILLGATTTFLVLLLLAFVPAPLFAEVGRTSALGVVAGLAAAFLVVPLSPRIRSARSRTSIPRSRTSIPRSRTSIPRSRTDLSGTDHVRVGADRIGSATARMAAAASRHPALAAVLLSTLLVAGAAFATQVRVESGSAENEFPQDDPNIVLQHRIEDEYGRLERAYIVFQGQEGSMARPDVLQALQEGASLARALPLHRESSSIVDLLAAQAATDEGLVDVVKAQARPDPAIPSDTDTARDRLEALFADPLWGRLAPFVLSRDLDLAVVAIQVTPWHDQAEMVELSEALQRLAGLLQERVGEDVVVTAAGSPVNRAAIVHQTPWDVAWVAGGGTVVVFAALASAWMPRRGREGLRAAAIGALLVATASILLLGAIPLLDAVYRIAGGAYNAGLSDMFLLAFAVTVGIGVDDYVQITSATWRHRDAGHPSPLAAAWRDVGRAVTGTSLTTLAAFVPLSWAYFIQSRNLAILVCCGAILAWALTLTFGSWGTRRVAKQGVAV